jgi:formate hydrogenlyase subunit 3/multisubunit Na+/H+ antiporter MnhD subunit
MMDHLTIASLAGSPTTLAGVGAAILLFGEIAALLSLPNLAWTFVISTVAEFGYVLIGFGVGGAAGDTGALMHLGFQAAMRGLVLAAGWRLVRGVRSASLDDLAGAGQRMPGMATLFGFGVFSVMGLSPFKGSFSKFIILYAAIEQGRWLVAIAGALAAIVAAVYYMLIVQRVCLEPARPSAAPAPAPASASARSLAIAYALAALTVVISLWPTPFLLLAARLAGFAGAEGVPQFDAPWAAPVLAPYLGAFVVYAIGRFSARARDIAAALLAIATLAAVALDGGLDPASKLFALLFSGVAALMVVYSLGYIGRAATANGYYFFAFLMTGSLIGLATAHEFGNFYLFWELMTWTSYFLVVHDRTPKAFRAGLVYFLMCAAGAYVMNFGILLLHAQIGSFEFAALADKASTLPPAVGAAIVACFFVGFAVKMGLVPLQSWLPLAHPEAPSSISGPLSGVLTKAGVFGVVKVLYVAFGAGALARFGVGGLDVNAALIALGCVTLLYGELRALFEPELKRMLAFSTIAQIGEIAAVLGLGTALATDASILRVVAHAAMKTLLFYAAGALILRTGRRRIDQLAGLGRVMPLSAGAFAVAALAIMGLPPFPGFTSKFLMLYAAATSGHIGVAAVMLLGGVIAIVYYARVLNILYFQPYQGEARLREAPAAMLASIGVLAAALVLGGLAPAWQIALVARVGDLAALTGAGAPQFATPWVGPALVPCLGGLLVYAIGRFSAPARDAAAAALAIVTVAVVALDGALDPTAKLFALLFSGVCGLMIVYSLGYIGRAAAANRYYFFAFLMTGSLIGLATTQELNGFYVFWELMTWTSYFLVIHEETEKARRAGFVYLLMCAAGAHVMQLGIVLLHAQTGSFAFSALADKAATLPLAVGAAIVACFFVGFAVKIGLVPLQSWLPLAHPEAPSSVSGPLSGILTKAGVLGFVKVLSIGFGAGALARYAILGVDAGTALMALGCLTLIYGEIRALFEPELKRMLAFSTIAQVGEIAVVLGIGTALADDAALLHVVNHAMMKTLLFYAAGAFILTTGKRRIEDLAGLGRVMPFTAGAYALASFAIMGLPPFSGFVSKFFMIYAAAMSGHVGVAALMLLGGVIAVFYYARVVSYLFYHPYKGAEGVREAPAAMLTAIGVLAAAIVVCGVAPGWQIDLVARVGDLAALRGALASGPLPGLVADWPIGATIAMVGAAVVFIAGRVSPVWAGRIAVATLIAALAGVLGQAGRYDLLSFCFAVLIAGVGALNMLHATAYLADSHRQGRFFAAFTVMIAGLIGMTYAKDILSFFAFWELMSSWALWAAISHEETAAARREGFKYFMFNTVGASFMFLGLALIAARAGTFELAALGAALKALPPAAVAPGVALVFLGLVMKAAMLPVRIDYQMHPALAPTPVSGYISSVLLKSGPWGVLKLFVLFGGAELFNKLGGEVNGQPVLLYVISVIAAVTILYAGAMAALQNGIKLLLIYSTVCQLGYVLLGVSLGTSLGVAGGLMHFVNHMLLKDALFLVAGAAMAGSHATMLDELGGLGRRMPFTFGVFLLSGLSLAGVPPLNGFSSKWLIFVAAFQSGHWALGAAAMIGSVFTLAAVMKFAHEAFMGTPTAKALAAKEAPLAMRIPMGALAAASVVFGFLPGLLLVPIAAIERELGFTPIAASFLGPLPGLEGWSPLMLSALTLLFFALLLPWLKLGRGAEVVRTNIHLCGVVDLAPEAMRPSAERLYETPDAVLRRALFAPERPAENEKA